MAKHQDLTLITQKAKINRLWKMSLMNFYLKKIKNRSKFQSLQMKPKMKIQMIRKSQ